MSESTINVVDSRKRVTDVHGFEKGRGSTRRAGGLPDRTFTGSDTLAEVRVKHCWFTISVKRLFGDDKSGPNAMLRLLGDFGQRTNF